MLIGRKRICLGTYAVVDFGCKVTYSSPLTRKIASNRLYFNNFKDRSVQFYGTVVDNYELNAAGCGIDDNGRKYIKVKGVRWFTNLDYKERHEDLILYKKYIASNYPRYDNFDAINIDKTEDIPCDYDGVMGVPITFLDKYNPDQFEILGITKTWFGMANKIYGEQIQVDKNGKESRVTKLNDGAVLEVEVPPTGKTYYKVNGKNYIQTFPRVLIRKIKK